MHKANSSITQFNFIINSSIYISIDKDNNKNNSSMIIPEKINNNSLMWLEKAMATHPSTLAWEIPWTEEPSRLQSVGSRRVGHDWATSLSLFTFMHWRRTWQPTPVFFPGKSHGRGSLVGCHLRGRTESDTTEQLHVYFHALEKDMATHSSVLAWRIPGMGEPGRLQSMGSLRVRHDWATSLSLFTFMH